VAQCPLPFCSLRLYPMILMSDAVTTGKCLLSSPQSRAVTQTTTNQLQQFPRYSAVQPPEFSNIQNDSITRAFCNRPRAANPTPIMLLHSTFGQFVDDCRDQPLDPKLAFFVPELVTEMCEFHQNEAVRGHFVL